MSLIAEFHLETPGTRALLERVPAMEMEVEQFAAAGPDSRGVYLFVWAWGDDFEALERAVEEDDGVDDPTILADLPDRRLYRIELTSGARRTTFSVWGELGAVLVSAVRNDLRWRVQMRFPDRESLARYVEFCRDNGFEFDLERLYSADRERQPLGLSECQRRTLEVALEEGYFDVPRTISQDELAERLGVSSQAVSERIRRATASLARTALG
jgi:predicted DNA binding protein